MPLIISWPHYLPDIRAPTPFQPNVSDSAYFFRWIVTILCSSFNRRFVCAIFLGVSFYAYLVRLYRFALTLMLMLAQTLGSKYLFSGLATVATSLACTPPSQIFFREHPDLSIVVNVTSDTPLATVVQYLAKHSSITNLSDELSHSLTVSPYAVARGGLSDVYLATRPDGTRVAIKCLRQHDPKHVKVCTTYVQLVDSFQALIAFQRTARELQTWSKLKHRNVLELYGLALFQGCLAMVSPWMKYGSITSVVKKWPEMDRYKLCHQLASAVEYLHKENVVHGDIKGDNILVDHDGTLKITDFGLSIMHDRVFQFSQTDAGGGTCRWMAPELYKEEGQRSCGTDVYAMGMEIITCDVPFREIKSGHMVILAVVNERRVPQVPELQAEPVSPRAAIMLNILHWCWKFEPSERPTARQVATLVDGLVRA
ncbi:hypothetical protein FRC10_002747 [Ceratobasidium sp. 414]|nr:hypothetical protein FRC10_002747 [Ceratobasidium sp. 414]